MLFSANICSSHCVTNRTSRLDEKTTINGTSSRVITNDGYATHTNAACIQRKSFTADSSMRNCKNDWFISASPYIHTIHVKSRNSSTARHPSQSYIRCATYIAYTVTVYFDNRLPLSVRIEATVPNRLLVMAVARRRITTQTILYTCI